MTTPTRSARPGAICAIHGIKHDRGNNEDRYNSRVNLVRTHGAACVYCGKDLQIDNAADTDTYMERERIIAGCYYRMTNLLPACHACNVGRSDRLSAVDYAARHGADAVARTRDAIKRATGYRRGR